MKVRFSEINEIAVVTLDNSVSNSITIELIKDFANLIANLEKNYKGLIIKGNEKFFSMGFNLPQLISFSQSEFEEFYDSFNDLILKIFTLSFPTCSVIEGHAVAGGFIIALSTDFRVAVSNKKIGLNEINLGVPVPFLAKELLFRLTDKKNATKLLYTGDFISTDEGLNIGLIDLIDNSIDIISKGIDFIDNYKKKPNISFEAIKKSLSLEIVSRFQKYRDWDKKTFLECWYNPSSQEILKETAKKF